MGRKNKGKSAASTKELDSEVAKTVQAKQKAGDDALAAKKYGDALAAYDEALKALPDRHGLVAELHGSKANVYLVDEKYKECVKECNQGLAVEGTNERVLKCRAHARFKLGFFKDALNDIQKTDSGAEKSTEDAEFEATVRAALSGKSSNGAAAGGGSTSGGGAQVTEANGATAAAAAKKPQPISKEQTQAVLKNNATQFVCKVTLENETKYVHVPYGISYYDLQQAIKSKWTGLHNFRILYHDKDQEWVTVTCQRDVARAQQEILTYAQRMINQRQRQGLGEQPPTCRFKLEKCMRAEVPAPPKEELPKGEERSKVVVKSPDPHADETVVELDDWLIDFANLFRDQLGIDPDKHVDMHTEGSERCAKALDTAVQLPEARQLFDESLDRFRDVTCVGLCNWANTHVCLGKKLVEHVAAKGGKLDDVREEFGEHMKQAIRRYNEALGYNENNVEALLGIGQVHMEEARMEAGIRIQPLDDVDSEAYKHMNQEELDEMTKSQGKDANAKLRAALESVTADDVKKSEGTWAKVYEHFKRAEKAAEGTKSAKTQAREEERADLVVSQPFPDDTHLLGNQVQIIWGNALYDQSQIWAGVGLDGWKDMVADAKTRFLSATCKESDINDALRNHIKADELDVPPEPEAEGATKPVSKSTDGAEASGAQKTSDGGKKEGAKGLPALKKKKGGK